MDSHDDDFATEHSRPTFSDEPCTEGPDESVPFGHGGDGGMDVRSPLLLRWRRWLLLPDHRNRGRRPG